MTMFFPLRGLRVLDATRLLPGPFATKILSDLGAEIIKIDDNQRPDLLTQIPPAVLGEESILAVYLHKNKKRLGLSLKNPLATKVLLKLVRKMDVFIESARPGVMDKMGLGFEKLKKMNPKIIYVSVTGYGQHGKLSAKAGHDMNFLVASGFMQALCGDKNLFMPSVQLADLVGGGLFAVVQILAALQQKKRRAVHLDVSMTQNLSLLSDMARMTSETAGIILGKSARYNIYRSRDGEPIVLGAIEEKFWHGFCGSVQRPDWLEKGYDNTVQPQLIKELSELFLQHPASFWRDLAACTDFCLTVGQTDVEEVSLLREIEVSFQKKKVYLKESGPFVGKSRQKFSPAGFDTVKVLRRFGFSSSDLQKLRQAGAINV